MANVANDSVDAHLTVPLEVVAASVIAAPKESPKNAANKEKASKKKRNDAILIQQLGKFMTFTPVTFEISKKLINLL